jgi:hypothetical protein
MNVFLLFLKYTPIMDNLFDFEKFYTQNHVEESNINIIESNIKYIEFDSSNTETLFESPKKRSSSKKMNIQDFLNYAKLGNDTQNHVEESDIESNINSIESIESIEFGNENHKCFKCHTSCKTKYHLNRHIKSHFLENYKFICDIGNCNFKSYRSDNLKMHKKRKHRQFSGMICVRIDSKPENDCNFKTIDSNLAYF